MEAIFKVIENIKKLDAGVELAKFMSNSTAQVYVLNLNRWEQLYGRGVDANGVPLGYYREKTKSLKNDPNLSHITLRETGEFYNTFKIFVGHNFIEIDANTAKPNGDLAEIHGEIIGLDDDSKEALGEYMLQNGINEQILQNILDY